MGRGMGRLALYLMKPQWQEPVKEVPLWVVGAEESAIVDVVLRTCKFKRGKFAPLCLEDLGE